MSFACPLGLSMTHHSPMVVDKLFCAFGHPWVISAERYGQLGINCDFAGATAAMTNTANPQKGFANVMVAGAAG